MNSTEQVQVQEPQSAPSVPSEPTEPTVGETLIAARQAQNLSVTDVANRLKLSVQQIHALERGEYDRLPGPVFVRGFARNYARLLKLDPEATVRAIDAHLPRADSEHAKAAHDANIPMPTRNAGRWPLIAGIAAVVFLGAALVDVLWPEAPSTGPAVAPVNSAVPVTVGPATSGSATPTSTPGVQPGAATAAPQPNARPADNATAASPPAPAAGAATVPATRQVASETGVPLLRFVFDHESWVQVRDGSGKVAFECLCAAGSSREVTATPPLAIVIGNAPGVRVTYADRAVDLTPHTHVAVARLTLQ